LPTAAAILADRLAAAGCRHAFGIPGGEVLAVMDALASAGIAFRLVKHENAGGFMAEGTWAMTGAPGVLLATVGPGVANTVNTAANALQDQVPLIILSGCIDAAEAETYTHQVIDQTALMRPVVKASVRLANGAVGVAVDKAIALALADPQGPVHIDIPVALATRDQPAHAPARPTPPAPMAPAPGPALEAARARLGAARRPVMIAGVGALAHGAAVAQVCERFGMPLITTYKAKGMLPEDHPLSLGGHGLSPKSDAILLPLLAQADLVLAVGYDPIEMRAGWRDPWTPGACIEIAHLPGRHGMHGAAVSFVGDVRAGLAALSEGLAPAAAVWENGAPAATRAELAAAFAPPPAWGPHAAFAAARRALPPETVVTADSGAHRILLSQMWACPAPRTLLQSSGFCTMGVSLPLAMGVRAARPDVPVMAVMGDAGAEMVLGEFATLRDMKAPLIVLVMVDESLALIELKQRRSGLANLGVDFPGTDWPAFAAAMGGHGEWVRDSAALEAGIAAGLGRGTFTLLAAVIGREAYDDAF
jgi:acetolactate synthase-1/2/3 large subunit